METAELLNLVYRVTNALNVLIALGICIACSAILSKVSRQTRCAVRFGIFAMFVGALATAAGGVWAFGDWIQTVLLAGVLIYLVANLRAPAATPSSSWSNRIAWALASVVALVCGVTFSLAA
jgi:hypothetical protein